MPRRQPPGRPAYSRPMRCAKQCSGGAPGRPPLIDVSGTDRFARHFPLPDSAGAAYFEIRKRERVMVAAMAVSGRDLRTLAGIVSVDRGEPPAEGLAPSLLSDLS